MIEKQTTDARVWVAASQIQEWTGPFIAACDARFSEIHEALTAWAAARRRVLSYGISPFGPPTYRLGEMNARARSLAKLADVAEDGRVLMGSDDVHFCRTLDVGLIDCTLDYLRGATESFDREHQIKEERKEPKVGEAIRVDPAELPRDESDPMGAALFAACMAVVVGVVYWLIAT